MPKKVRSVRLSDRTWSQLEQLAEWLQVGNRTRVIEILTERATVEMEREKMSKKMTSRKFVEMCGIALEHWDFQAADEPYRSSKVGLEYLRDHPLTDEQLAEIEQSRGRSLIDSKGNFDWDWLQELAVGTTP